MDEKPILRIKDIESLFGLSRSFVGKMRKTKTFPKPIETGTRTPIWKTKDIKEWLGLT